MDEIKRLFLKYNPGGAEIWKAIVELADGDPVAAVDRIQELAEKDPTCRLPDDVLNEMYGLFAPE